MRITNLEDTTFEPAFSIAMSKSAPFGAGDRLRASYGVIQSGGATTPHKHDESEAFVVLSGCGEVIVDGASHPVAAGAVALFNPFESHILRNTGDEPLRFADFYWREPAARHEAVRGNADRRLAGRPVFVFSTPPTPNGDLHLGHLSGPYLGADVYVRFLRSTGHEAYHLTGSDDYQSYVVGRARQEGSSPQEIADRYAAAIQRTLTLMDIQLDQFTISSHDPTYADGLRGFFSRLIAAGIRREMAPGLFDGATGAYLYEVDVTGACPTCGSPSSGNICEEWGEPNTCVEFTAPRSRLSDSKPHIADVERWMVNVSTMKDMVLLHQRRAKVSPRLQQLAQEVLSRPNFRVAISHPATWGVTPAESPDGGQVIWVWPEMAYGFLHGIEALGHRLQRNWHANQPQATWKIVHFFGYDNSFYHTILYPALYKLAFPDWDCDIDYNENEFYLLDGLKFSTSRRHAIWGCDILTPESVDAVRWYLSWTRGEYERTNFTLAHFHESVEQILLAQWQAWLADLGRRVAEDFGGCTPDAGSWTPMQIGYLDSLCNRLAALRSCYGADGFSLNRVVDELNAMVTQAQRLGHIAKRLRRSAESHAEYRTFVALELATAQLLAATALPLLPRFAIKLADALGMNDVGTWPTSVDLMRPGTVVTLSGRQFFVGLRPEASEPSSASQVEEAS